MANNLDTEVIKDGQLAVATVEQSGTIVSGGGAEDTTCIVETETGKQLAIKIFEVGEGGGGGGITVDDAMSDTSTNPVQNKVITAALGDKQDTLVSGTNIKTVNSNSLLGSGNIDIDSLPDQTGQSGKFLTTDGTDASWGAVPAPAGVYTEDNLVGGTGISIDSGTISGGIDSDTLLCYHFNDSVENLSQYASGDNYTSQAGDLRSDSSVTYVNGEFGKALAFDGTSSINFAIINNAYNLYGLDEITYEFWQKLDGTNSETGAQIPPCNPRMLRYTGYSSADVIHFGIQYSSYYSKYEFASAGLGISDFRLDATQEGYLNTNGFNHLALCWKSGQFIKVYVNGHLLVSNTNNPVLASYQQSYPGEIYFTSMSNVTWWAIDEFRFSKVLRYTGDSFEVPTKEFDSSTRDVKKINNTQPAPTVMTGATSSASGERGLVPAPASADRNKFLKGDATWATINALQNNSTGTNSLSILGQATTSTSSVSIGYNAHAETDYSIAIGESSYTDRETQSVAVGYVAAARSVNGIAIGSSASVGPSGSRSIAIGANSTSGGTKSIAIGGGDGYASSQGANAQGANSISIGHSSSTASNKSNTIAIGYWAQANQDYAIQLGTGTNSTANTFSVGLASGHNYQLLDANGQIPAARLGTGFDATKTQVLKNVNGVLTWVDEA